eukprot:8044254-Pyramimonas_sp.AAC.1
MNSTRSASRGGNDRTCRPPSAWGNATKFPTKALMLASTGRHAPESVLQLNRRTIPRAIGSSSLAPSERFRSCGGRRPIH